MNVIKDAEEGEQEGEQVDELVREKEQLHAHEAEDEQIVEEVNGDRRSDIFNLLIWIADKQCFQTPLHNPL